MNTMVQGCAGGQGAHMAILCTLCTGGRDEWPHKTCRAYSPAMGSQGKETKTFTVVRARTSQGQGTAEVFYNVRLQFIVGIYIEP